MDLTERQFRSLFDARTWERGVSYARQGRVSRIRYEADGNITASVRGSGGKTYSQTIFPIRDGRGLSGRCSCPVGINCKHVAAVCHNVAAQHTESFVRDDTAILSADRPKPPCRRSCRHWFPNGLVCCGMPKLKVMTIQKTGRRLSGIACSIFSMRMRGVA